LHLLLAPPGTGKSWAGAAVVAEMVRTESKRVLVLVPAPLRIQWVDSVLQLVPEAQVRAVDQKGYRELVASSPAGESPWSAAGIYVLGTEFAKKEDIAVSLTSVHWDLVIVDEAHRLASPQRSAFMKRLFQAGVVSRLLMLT